MVGCHALNSSPFAALRSIRKKLARHSSLFFSAANGIRMTICIRFPSSPTDLRSRTPPSARRALRSPSPESYGLSGRGITHAMPARPDMMVDLELDDLKREFLAEADEKVREIQAKLDGEQSPEALQR